MTKVELDPLLVSIRRLTADGTVTHVSLQVQELRILVEKLDDAVQALRDIHYVAQSSEDHALAIDAVIELCEEIV